MFTDSFYTILDLSEICSLFQHRLLRQGGDEVEISEVAINVGMDWSPLENVRKLKLLALRFLHF
jgi:hypothetical protein